MECAQRIPEHPYLRSFIPSGQMRLTRLPAPVSNPSPWLGFRARRRLRHTRTLLSVVSLCPDRSSWSPSATGKDAAARSYTGWVVRPLLQLESPARVAAIDVEGHGEIGTLVRAGIHPNFCILSAGRYDFWPSLIQRFFATEQADGEGKELPVD